ncbi:MAG: rhodanese-like domain-containing protein [Alphaproteobacteria bacterium]|nr:rhodanese-like domain-containing protein [Alphaproteobacteria bacterium]
MSVQNLSATEVAQLLQQDAILLVDVREAHEYAVERISGAAHCPLSRFDPRSLPKAGKRAIVFSCASGVRSARAAAICLAAGLAHDRHLKGGIQAWKASGLPVERSR